MPLKRLVIVVGLVLLPLAAAAEEVTMWDFMGGQLQGEWRTNGVTAQKTATGLRVTAQSEGALQHVLEPGHPFDTLTLVVRSQTDIQAGFLWHPHDLPKDVLGETKFAIRGGDVPRYIDIVPHYRSWDPDTDALFFSFPAGSDVTIMEIRVRRWSAMEKLREAGKSFWHMDEFRPYSINFLWGPLITYTQPSRTQMFDSLPPPAISAARIFYALILLAGVLSGTAYVFLGRASPTARKARAVFVATVIGVWVLFDLRMGTEVIRYALTDLRTFVLQPVGSKLLRTHEEFYDVALQVAPVLRKEAKYLLLVPDNTPFYANMRYMTYPSLPIRPGDDLSGVHVLFVYERPDIHLDERNRVIMSNGTSIAASGAVLQHFANGSFLYRAQ